MLAGLFGLLHRGQRGQMIVLAALTISIAIAGTGLAVDVGLMMHTRTELQKDVDAMALAGAQALCGLPSCENQADADARHYGTENDVTGADTVTIDFPTDCDGDIRTKHDQIMVRMSRYRSSLFARIVGFNGTDIGACATARKFALGGTAGVRPFAVEDKCIAHIPYGGLVTLKYDAPNDAEQTCDTARGNFATLDIGGTGDPGGSGYLSNIKYGSTVPICASADPTCTDPTVKTETGNDAGNTRTGIDFLFSTTPPECDTWGEVATVNGTVASNCNPWRDGYQGGTRIIIIPVVSGLWGSGGYHSVTILRFAIVFVEEFGTCTGNDCTLKARFMKSVVSIAGATRMDLSEGDAVTIVALVK